MSNKTINMETQTYNGFNKTIFIMFAIVGVIIKLFFSNNYSIDGMSGPASTNIWSYGIISFAMVGLLFIGYSVKHKAAFTNANSFEYIIDLFKFSIPGFLLLIILFWLMSLNTAYYTQINKGNISDEFNNYSFVSSFVIAIQLFVLYKFLNIQFADNDNKNKKNPYTLLSYLLTLTNIILIGIMTIILKYFTTDG
jgi:hypothetical protein